MRHRARGIIACVTLLAAAWVVLPALAQEPGTCRVLDPELQGHYRGGCANGLAEGEGEARGVAHYKGAFKAGRKHGKGAKTWPTGDRYEGEFADDHKQGRGIYTWGGRSPWAGEHYSGDYWNDQRHGYGVYEWPDGDRYAGRWESDRPVGNPTPRMLARARAYGERVAATAKPGASVCRKMMVGTVTEDWVSGTVIASGSGMLSIRIDDAGRFSHVVEGQALKRGVTVEGGIGVWLPCRR